LANMCSAVGRICRRRHKMEVAVAKVRVGAFSLSLDGFGAGLDQSLQNPIGVNGMELHQWAFKTQTFRKMHGQEGGETGIDDQFAARPRGRFAVKPWFCLTLLCWALVYLLLSLSQQGGLNHSKRSNPDDRKTVAGLFRALQRRFRTFRWGWRAECSARSMAPSFSGRRQPATCPSARRRCLRHPSCRCRRPRFPYHSGHH